MRKQGKPCCACHSALYAVRAYAAFDYRAVLSTELSFDFGTFAACVSRVDEVRVLYAVAVVLLMSRVNVYFVRCMLESNGSG